MEYMCSLIYVYVDTYMYGHICLQHPSTRTHSLYTCKPVHAQSYNFCYSKSIILQVVHNCRF